MLRAATLPTWGLHHPARFYAAASTKAPDEKQASADRAMELLNKAVKAGSKNPA